MFVKKYGKTEECLVDVSKELAVLCKPEGGDPRGPMGVPSTLKSEQAPLACVREMMMRNGDKVLRGVNSDFVCSPQAEYEYVLNKIEID